MSARSIWQGMLVVQKQRIAVKFYSAVQDRQIHFHLLHKRDRTRVQQEMVDAETEKPVPLDEARKAFEVEKGLYVAVTREEVDGSAPEPAREVEVRRFVPMQAIEPQFADPEPYYLGPGEDAAVDYFALVQALEKKKRAGIASWTMRKALVCSSTHRRPRNCPRWRSHAAARGRSDPGEPARSSSRTTSGSKGTRTGREISRNAIGPI